MLNVSTFLLSMPLPKPFVPVIPICPYFFECGGCDSQDVAYADQISFKEESLKGLFGPLGNSFPWKPFLASTEKYPKFYRNKIRFSFVEHDGVIYPSRHRKGDEKADIPVEQCFLQSEICNSLIRFTASFATTHNWSLYNPLTGTGWLKHMLVREGKNTGEVLVCLVTDTAPIPGGTEWVSLLTKQFPNVVSVHHTTTNGKSSSELTTKKLFGTDGIREKVGDYIFFISPHAFFQTNSRMIEVLYTTIRDTVQENGAKHVWDLYAGSSTIGIFVSQVANKVTCIESNPANISDAELNISNNSIKNVHMVGGTVEKVLTSAFIKEEGTPDLIIVDPPRAGLSEHIKQLLPNIGPHSLIYVSCNPYTCARDCQELVRKGYAIQSVRGIDMYPHTLHCEMIVELKK